MQKILLSLICLFATSAYVMAQDAHGPELFGGYSYMRLDGGTFPIDFNANGVNASVTGYLTKRFGIVGDFSAHYEHDGSTFGTTVQSVHESVYQVLGGAQWKFVNGTRFTPFVHGLGGLVNTRITTDVNNSGTTIFHSTDSAKDLALALGGGLDIGLTKRVSLRAIQFDYNPRFIRDRTFGTVTFNGQTLHHIRISVGLVFR